VTDSEHKPPPLRGLARRVKRRYKARALPRVHIDNDGRVYKWDAWAKAALEHGKFELTDTLEEEVRRQIWGRDYDAAEARKITDPRPLRRRARNHYAAYLLAEAKATADAFEAASEARNAARKKEKEDESND
jgi:hypothetical protein